ncbi:MAG: PD-(D/E)XK nuclease family protein [Actinomycetia bacterium]|nr:PD-(D/E)XK nuclease family protein [Actinomycetes bacterium]
MMSDDLIQISYSDIAAFHVCSRRYYHEKRLRMGTLPDARTTAEKRGTLMHTLLEGASDGRVDATGATALFARAQLNDSHEQEALLRATRRVLDSPAYAEVTAGRNLRRERQFYLALQNPARDKECASRFLKGYIDIQSTRDDGSLLILDYKSGTRADATAADYEDQARCYALVGLADGHPAVEVRFIRPEVSVSAQDDAPQLFTWGPYTQDDYADIEATLFATIDAMEQAGADSPATPSLFACRSCPVPQSACSRKKPPEEQGDKR